MRSGPFVVNLFIYLFIYNIIMMLPLIGIIELLRNFGLYEFGYVQTIFKIVAFACVVVEMWLIHRSAYFSSYNGEFVEDAIKSALVEFFLFIKLALPFGNENE